jgi:conjugative transposon TraM protein
MESKTHSQAFLRQRKFLTVLPLLVLPFVIGIFIALGGGKVTAKKQDEQTVGLNTKLPDAHFKIGKEKDKMGIYEDAKKDSLKLRRIVKDSALQHVFEHTAADHDLKNISSDPNEEKVLEKLSQLKKVMSQQSTANNPVQRKPQNNTEENNLQNKMQAINAKNTEPDPEINKLSGMLDKIMLIQHPESLQDSMKKLSEKNKTQTFAVTTSQPEENITLLGNPADETQNQNAFFGLSDETNSEGVKQNCIEAVIPETETLVSGATVKLRLLDDIFINGIKIPKDEFIYGTASFSNERLKITINSIRCKNNILPVALSVYDMDGMAGIYIPGSINRDVSKESADDAISTLGLTSVDQSVGAQAAVAGIQAAKTLASKKIRLIRVNIKSGYKVLLKDNNQKN